MLDVLRRSISIGLEWLGEGPTNHQGKSGEEEDTAEEPFSCGECFGHRPMLPV